MRMRTRISLMDGKTLYSDWDNKGTIIKKQEAVSVIKDHIKEIQYISIFINKEETIFLKQAIATISIELEDNTSF